MNSILEKLTSGQVDLSNYDNLVNLLIKEFVEHLMQSELTEHLNYEKHDPKGNNSGNSRNGTYNRILDTKYGKINNLNVPRDRNGDFNTALFQPYQRRDNWLEEMIINLYSKGVSTREIADIIEKMYGSHYSASTVSNITEVALEELESWHTRKLKNKYSIIFIDGMSIKVRRKYVDNESVYIIVGIDEDGYREIIDFYIAPSESSNVWEEYLLDLKQRGVRQVLLGVMDGLPGLTDAFLKVFPKADVQRCVVHKLRNTAAKVRKKHSNELLEDLKPVYKSPNLKFAEEALKAFQNKWENIYPTVVKSWLQDKNELLAFYKYPEPIRKSIYTTNWIERTIKEIRKRIRPTNSLPTIDSAKKLIYLRVLDYNDRWSQRRMKGFLKAKEKLAQLFKDRYDS